MRGLLETRDETEKQLRLWRSNLLLAESNRATRRAAKMLRPQHEAMIECFEYLRRLNDVMEKIKAMEAAEAAKADAAA